MLNENIEFEEGVKIPVNLETNPEKYSGKVRAKDLNDLLDWTKEDRIIINNSTFRKDLKLTDLSNVGTVLIEGIPNKIIIPQSVYIKTNGTPVGATGEVGFIYNGASGDEIFYLRQFFNTDKIERVELEYNFKLNESIGKSIVQSEALASTGDWDIILYYTII